MLTWAPSLLNYLGNITGLNDQSPPPLTFKHSDGDCFHPSVAGHQAFTKVAHIVWSKEMEANFYDA